MYAIKNTFQNKTAEQPNFTDPLLFSIFFSGCITALECISQKFVFAWPIKKPSILSHSEIKDILI